MPVVLFGYEVYRVGHWECLEPVEPHNTRSYAEVSGWQYIETAHTKHQKHVDCPFTDAFYSRKFDNDIAVTQLVKRIESNGSINNMTGQVLLVCSLLFDRIVRRRAARQRSY